MFAWVPATSAQDDVEMPDLKFGFVKLTDCAPLVIATKLGSFEAAGRYVTHEAHADFKNHLDQVVTGELDGAHMLVGASRVELAPELMVNESALSGRFSTQPEATDSLIDFPSARRGAANATTPGRADSIQYEFRATGFLPR